jgi:dTDP-4-dehydrorhamnose reductase
VATGYRHCTPGLYPLNVCDADAVAAFVSQHAIDAVVYLAGSKDVRWCEENSADARTLNVGGVSNMLTALERRRPDIFFLFMSSDYVFDGRRGQYRDTDPISPSTEYGRNKVEAEALVQGSPIHSAVVRTSAVMGEGSPYFGWLRESLRSGKKFGGFDNVFFTPTPVQLLQAGISEILAKHGQMNKRVRHVTYPERISRYAFASLCASLLGKQPSESCYPETLDFSSSLMPPDLSMVPSAGMLPEQLPDLSTYLRELL